MERRHVEVPALHGGADGREGGGHAPAEIAHHVDCAHVAGRSGCSQTVWSPAAGQSEPALAVASADEGRVGRRGRDAAVPAWRTTPLMRRARVLDRFRHVLRERADTLAETIGAEHGKTHDDAIGEVTRGSGVIELSVGAPHLMESEFSETVGTGIDSYAIRQPLGVVARNIPLDSPAPVPMWMLPVALRADKTLVLEPSARDPSASLPVAERPPPRWSAGDGGSIRRRCAAPSTRARPRARRSSPTGARSAPRRATRRDATSAAPCSTASPARWASGARGPSDPCSRWSAGTAMGRDRPGSCP